MEKVKHIISSKVLCLFRRIRLKLGSKDGGKMSSQRKFIDICGTSRFFWPNITQENAELALLDRDDGTFLVRSKNIGRNEVLELVYKREGNIMKMRIDYNEKGFSLDHSNESLPSDRTLDGLIQGFMSKCKSHSLVVADETKQNFGLMKLKFPLTRNITLMDHCRKAALASYPCVESLNLPRELTAFLLGDRQPAQ